MSLRVCQWLPSPRVSEGLRGGKCLGIVTDGLLDDTAALLGREREPALGVDALGRLGVGDGEDLSRIYKVGIADLLLVCLEYHRVVDALAVDHPRQLPQIVARLDDHPADARLGGIAGIGRSRRCG